MDSSFETDSELDSDTPLSKRPCIETLESSYSYDTSDDDVAFCSSDTDTESDDDMVFISDKEDNEIIPTAGSINEEQIELKEIGMLLTSNCCMDLCARQLCVNDVLLSRKKFVLMGTVVQRQWLTDKLIDNSHTSSTGELNTTYLIAGKNVCKNTFCEVNGISKSRLQRIRKAVSSGHFNANEHGNQGKRRPTSRVQEARVWMERHFHLIGDKQPDKNKIHLPSWEKKEDVYGRYKGDMLRAEISEASLVGLSTFYRIWNEDFPNVAIPEVRYAC